jgi:hypothetical protein
VEKGQGPGPKGLKKRHSVVAVLPVEQTEYYHTVMMENKKNKEYPLKSNQ